MFTEHSRTRTVPRGVEAHRVQRCGKPVLIESIESNKARPPARKSRLRSRREPRDSPDSELCDRRATRVAAAGPRDQPMTTRVVIRGTCTSLSSGWLCEAVDLKKSRRSEPAAHGQLCRTERINKYNKNGLGGRLETMFVRRRVSARRVQVPATRKSNALPLMDVIVGRFIAGCCLLLAVDVAHNSYEAAFICVLSAVVAAMAVPIGRRRRPRRRSTVTAADLAPRTNEANAVEQQNFYAGG